MEAGRICNALGLVCLVIFFMAVPPGVVAAISGEKAVLFALLWTAVPAIVLNRLLGWCGRRSSSAFRRREGLLALGLGWVLAVALGAMPYAVSGCLADPVDAVFESMSGLTATGVTAASGFDAWPRSLLLWRALTHWIGGLAAIALALAFLPLIGAGSRGPGAFDSPSLDQDDLRPRFRESMSSAGRIYATFTILLAGALALSGVGPFDAILLGLGTVATGGFPVQDHAGAGGIPAAARFVLVPAMFLAGVNLNLFARARREGLRVFRQDPEFRAWALLAAAGAAAIAAIAWATPDAASGRRPGAAVFHAVSGATTTGHWIPGDAPWPPAATLLLFVLILIGACEGSAAGGIKVWRVALVVRAVGHEIRRFIRPHRTSAILFGGQPVAAETLRAVAATVLLHLGVVAAGGLLLCITGFDLVRGVTTSAAMLSNAGLILGPDGPVGPFTEAGAAAKGAMTLLMLLGRLEVLTVLVLFLPGLYRD